MPVFITKPTIRVEAELAKELQASVRDFYERCGASFSRTRRTLVWPEERIAAARVKPGMTVADIGAGNGRFARLLPPGVRYIGVEPSARLRSKAPASLDMRPGELPHLPIENMAADVTVCIAVLHHIPGFENRATAVDELARITKPGGLVIAASWRPEAKNTHRNIPGGDPGDIWIPWESGRETGKRYVHLMDEREWSALWSRPELRIERIGLFGKTDWTERPSDARNWFVIAQRV